MGDPDISPLFILPPLFFATHNSPLSTFCHFSFCHPHVATHISPPTFRHPHFAPPFFAIPVFFHLIPCQSHISMFIFLWYVVAISLHVVPKNVSIFVSRYFQLQYPFCSFCATFNHYHTRNSHQCASKFMCMSVSCF